ncbi:hypothetical protein, partial [Methylovulum sp.]|uniref:hypothetical protein n=1 Tax=Methylovulum sp. TaxID=1916980 RepID=UPI00260DF509
MVALMAGLGYASSGAASSIAAPPKSSPDTGTVLGDAGKSSESIGNVVKTLEDIHASEYAELRGINNGIGDLQAALQGTITTLFQAGGLDTSNTGMNIGRTPKLDVGDLFSVTGIASLFEPQNFTSLLDAVSGIAFINALFSGGYRDVVGRGIQTPAQNVGNGMMGGFDAQQYNVVKTRQWDLLSDSTSYQTVF